VVRLFVDYIPETPANQEKDFS